MAHWSVSASSFFLSVRILPHYSTPRHNPWVQDGVALPHNKIQQTELATSFQVSCRTYSPEPGTDLATHASKPAQEQPV